MGCSTGIMSATAASLAAMSDRMPSVRAQAGRMFWLRWKALSGSYLALTACNRA
jgi:hypothetical protein